MGISQNCPYVQALRPHTFCAFLAAANTSSTSVWVQAAVKTHSCLSAGCLTHESSIPCLMRP
jgi:hypothetical protein